MFAICKESGNMKQETCKAKRQYGIFKATMMMLCILLCSDLTFFMVYRSIQGNSKAIDSNFEALSLLFSTLMTVFFTIFISRRYMKRNWISLGLGKERRFKDYGKGLLIGFILMASIAGIAYIMGGFEAIGIQNFSFGLLFLYFIGFMIQGFNEELLLRGFMMNSLSTKYTMPMAIFLNSFIFSCLHLANSGLSFLAFINLVLAGVLFSIIALYYDNIFASSAAHSMWNFAQGNMFGSLVSGLFLPTSILSVQNRAGMEWVNGGNFGLEGGIAVTIVECLAILIFCYSYARKSQKKRDASTLVS